MFPLPLLRVILCVWKGCYELFSATDCVPAAMVEMQVRVDDDVDVFGRNSCGVQIVEQFSGLLVDLHHLFGQFVADAGLNQNVFICRCARAANSGPRQGGSSRQRDLFGPQGLWDHSKEGSAIEEVGSVGDDGEFEVAESCAMHREAVSN